jgi:hypothetical protein
MFAVVRCGTLVALLGCSVACTADGPTAPNSLPTPAVPAQPRPAVDVPPLSGPAITYQFINGRLPSYQVAHYTTTSEYVLYDNNAFQHVSSAGELTGIYQQEAARITFRFAASSQWEATATLNGNKLEVQYNDVMSFAGFEDADYRRSP